MRRTAAFFLIITYFLISPQLIYPAEGPSGTEQAGVLEKELREREHKKRLEEIELPVIETKYEEEKVEGIPETEFYVSRINVQGVTIFPIAEIDALKTKYENQTSSLQKLKSLALDITSYYRMRGFVTTRAVVPPQKLEQGEVTIQIHEGKVGQIRIEGLKYSREALIRNRFRIKKGDILRYHDLERALAVLNANPDRSVRVVLERGEEPETTDIVLKVEEQFPFHAGYGFNNLGTVSTGPFRQSVSYSAGNLLGWDDQFSGRVEISERRDFIGVSNSYLLPLDSRGDLFTFDFSHVDVEIGKDLKPLAAVGRASVFGPTVIIPFLQRRFLSGEWTMGFDYKRIRTLINGNVNAKDDLRVFRFGPNLIENDKWGRTILTNAFQIAFAGFLGGLNNNDPVASRREADGYFWQYNFTLARLQNIWNGIQAVGRFSAQLTPHRLVPAQEFRLGGFDTVRGYPEGSFLGDYGFQGSLELRVPPYFVPKDWKWPRSEIALRDSIRGVCFVDFGKAFVSSPFEIEEKSERLVGVGGGIRVSISRNVQARVDWGVPVAGRSSEGKAARIYFSLQVQI